MSRSRPLRRRSRTGAALAAGAVLVMGIVTWLGCDREARRVAKPAALVVSGDTGGWITPCGCASNQSGGLLRRGTYLARLRDEADVLYIDAGGAAGGVSDYHRVKFESILAGEVKMGVAAHNVGRSEAALGAAFLRDVARRTGAPLVSANVTDADGSLVAEPIRVVPVGGRRVAVTGVLSPAMAGDGLRVGDPRQAVLNAAAGAKGTYDALVVLAYLPEPELHKLAAALPEADAVLGGPTGQALSPRNVGPTVLAAATNKGKFLVKLSVPPPATSSDAGGGDGWAGGIDEMGPALADHAEQQANVQAYLARLAAEDFTAEQSGLVPPFPPDAPDDYRVAGSAACLSCHADEHASWTASKHAHAGETLQAKGFHVDPYCLSCHTTAYGLPGGFISPKRSAALAAVGCESCHGPSQAHVAAPKIHRTPFNAIDQCIRCHDRENSPAFQYDAYWSRIRHGERQTTPAAVGVTP